VRFGSVRSRISWLFGAVLLLGVPQGAWGETSAKLTAPATPAEIDQLIHDLGHTAYERRRFATRRLCAIGPPARRQLIAAQQSGSPEIALRAGHLLDVFKQFMFAGVEVELAPSRSQLEWDESIDLRVTLTNHSEFPARVPMELSAKTRSDEGTDARQVADMLDVSEWLHVTGPKGRDWGLRVDDINLDDGVTAAVQKRLTEGPVDTLAPGQSQTLVVKDFNRGWARVPMLDAGRYRLQFDYRPEWSDPVLFDAGVGRVQSPAVVVTITKGAPATVSRRGVEASVKLERQGPLFVARLINRTDQTILVNHNFGSSPPFAVGRWVYDGNGVMHEFSATDRPGNSWSDFKADALRPLEPGGSVELSRITAPELHRRMIAKGVANGDAGEVYYTYSSLCDRNWQRRQGDTLLGNDAAPKVFRALLPRRLLAGWYTSNRLGLREQREPGGND